MNILVKLIVTVAALLAVTCVVSCNRYQMPQPLIRVVQRGGEHFEGPHWAKDQNALYWVDIMKQNVHKLDLETGNITSKHISYGPVSLVVTVKDKPDLLLVSVRSELFFLNWNAPDEDNLSLTMLTAYDLGLPENRCNDGKVDAKGRLWFGTMGNEVNNEVNPDQGTLYMLNEYNYMEPAVKIRPVSVSNGIAWTADNKYMFYIDTPTRNIDVMNFDLERGTISNRRTLFSFQANNVTGLPDGMTIDTDGNLWVACFNGGKVIKVDTLSGKLLEQHNMPVSKVSSVMFGGHDLSTLYVTTSRVGLTPAELTEQPDAGSLFAIEGTGSRGRPENKFVFRDESFKMYRS